MADRVSSSVSNVYPTNFYEPTPMPGETQTVAAAETRENQPKPRKLPPIAKTVSFTALGCDTEAKLTRAGYMAAAARAGIADTAAQNRFADQMLARNPQLTLNGTIDLDDAKVKARLLNREVDFTIDDTEKTALEQFRAQYVKDGGAIRFNRTTTIDLRQAQTADGVNSAPISSPKTRFSVLLDNRGDTRDKTRILAQYAENTYRGGNLWGANYRQIAELSAEQGVNPKITKTTPVGNKVLVEFGLATRDRAVVHENYKTVQAELNRARAAYEDFANNNEVSSFLRGVFNGAVGAVKGTVGLLNVPETMRAVWQIVSDPKGIFDALYEELGETWEEFKNAPPNKKSEMVGELVGAAVVEILLGKGIGKAGSILEKTKTGAEIIEKAKSLTSATTAKIAEAFSDEAAQAASARLRQRLSGTQFYGGIPADALTDLMVVAANKVKNGAVKFGDFSKQMVAEYGDKIKPKLLEFYQDAFEKIHGIRKTLTLDELLGGHSIDKHVGKSESRLRQRLLNEPDTEIASSFRNYETANKTIGKAIRENNAKIEQWLVGNADRPLTLKTTMDNPIGIILERGKGGSVGLKTAKETNKAEIVIIKDNTPQGWHVLTSYPSK